MAEGRGNHRNSDKRRRILDAAVSVFAEKGFFQARVSDIARLAGVADGTIYLYFKNKDDLLISIFEEKMKEINVKFRDALACEKDALARFRCLIAMHLAGFQAYPELAAVLQVELRQSSRFMREYKKVELKNYLDLVGEVVRDGQQQGVFRQDLPLSLVKRFIFGTLDEVVSTWVLAGRPYDLETLTEPLMDLFVNGLGVPEVKARLAGMNA
ncbi:TetR/AcrR family transcriptional regulator [Desulfosoma caldarium]|uniref:TetR family transcriptional regulator n=1 Tax=Desulfosoma caldarium TaxID=610254 RepID=A0A3N1UHR8_9BACT|nr:TetR/AcrR family transcriptional regulator [Desulfosoma caldarium]ROQ90815.1 TetR family transcriptional regulator [Desulfosoma caldarium]